tara:strand:- start:1660 stop:2043 length:384 start_codon:yes stop_codon:yes gene_type:complete
MPSINADEICAMCGNFLDDDLRCPECTVCNSAQGELFKGKYSNMKHDPVNNPNHYNRGGLECIAAIEAMTENMSGDIAPHAANVLKYVWRCEYKNGLQDIDKAIWYLNRLRDRWIQRNEVEKSGTGS